MKLALKLFLVLTFTAVSSVVQADVAACFAVSQRDLEINACELEQKTLGCEDLRKDFNGEFSPSQTREMLVDCRKNKASIVADSVKNCALPALAMAGSITKFMVTRMAGNALNFYFLVDVLDAGFTQDQACFKDNDGKRKLIQMHNQKVSQIQEILDFENLDPNLVQEAKHLTYGENADSKHIENMNCTELIRQVYQKEQKLNAIVGSLYGKKKLDEDNLREINDIMKSTAATSPFSNIPTRCLNTETQWKLQCEVAAARMGVATAGLQIYKSLKAISAARALRTAAEQKNLRSPKITGSFENGTLVPTTAQVKSLLGTSSKKGDFSNTKGLSIDELISRAPKNAKMRTLVSNDNSQIRGFELRWTEGAKTWKLRIHGPDALAPAGSNAATGWVARIQSGKRNLDGSGKMHPQGVMSRTSPNYDDILSNNVHIPVQGNPVLQMGP